MTAPTDADRAKADRLMSMLDNVGAFDHSNDEERDRYYVAAHLADALADARAEAVQLRDAMRALAKEIDREVREVAAEAHREARGNSSHRRQRGYAAGLRNAAARVRDLADGGRQ